MCVCVCVGACVKKKKIAAALQPQSRTMHPFTRSLLFREKKKETSIKRLRSSNSPLSIKINGTVVFVSVCADVALRNNRTWRKSYIGSLRRSDCLCTPSFSSRSEKEEAQHLPVQQPRIPALEILFLLFLRRWQSKTRKKKHSVHLLGRQTNALP